jgi:Telomere capping, CST complex subunit
MRYELATGLLVIQHNFPSGSNHRALVDINLILDTPGKVDTDTGSWVNVIGYITATTLLGPAKVTENLKTSATSIQAIALWSARSINIKEYENALVDHQAEYNQALTN